MLFVRDKGQMCNNILQYGHVYAWGREHGRQTMSMRFAYKYQYFHICSTRWHNFATYVFAKLMGRIGVFPIIDFDNDECSPERHQANEQLMLSHRTALVQGWLVRFYDLFLKYRDEICQLFAFLPKTEQDIALLMGPDENDRLTIGLHIRRGDYKTFKNGAYYFDDKVYINYVKEALRQYGEGKKVRIFVCSNDPNLNQQAYRQALPEVEILFPAGTPDHDLCLLSHCDVLVGTVSTFSLVASMYRDLPLCWIDKAEVPANGAKFMRFDYLFRHTMDGVEFQN